MPVRRHDIRHEVRCCDSPSFATTVASMTRPVSPIAASTCSRSTVNPRIFTRSRCARRTRGCRRAASARDRPSDARALVHAAARFRVAARGRSSRYLLRDHDLADFADGDGRAALVLQPHLLAGHRVADRHRGADARRVVVHHHRRDSPGLGRGELAHQATLAIEVLRYRSTLFQSSFPDGCMNRTCGNRSVSSSESRN